MPITKSAQKALRQNLTRQKRNRATKNRLKGVIKKFRGLVAAGKKDEAQTVLVSVYKALDKTAKKGIIKKNKASRTKSRLARLLAKKN